MNTLNLAHPQLPCRTIRSVSNKVKLVFLVAGASAFLLSGQSPVKAHSYESCATICFNAGGTVKQCAKKCNNHKHSGGGVQKLDDLGFTSASKPVFSKSGSKAIIFKQRRRRQ